MIESIEKIQLDKNGALEREALKFPLDSMDEFKLSNLPMHIVAKGGAQSVVNGWNQHKTCSSLVKFAESNTVWTRMVAFTADEIARRKETARKK